MISNTLRLVYWLAIFAMLYLALTASKWGMVIETGEQRHLMAFTLLPMLSAVAWPNIALTRQFLCYAAVGAVIEGLQWAMAVGRKAELGDLLLDGLAAAIALVAMALLRWADAARRNRANS